MIQHEKWVPSQPNRDGTHFASKTQSLETLFSAQTSTGPYSPILSSASETGFPNSFPECGLTGIGAASRIRLLLCVLSVGIIDF